MEGLEKSNQDTSFEQTPDNTKKEPEDLQGLLESKIEITKDQGGKTIGVIVIEGEKRLDLCEFLPEGTVFYAHDSPPGFTFSGYHFWPRDLRSSDNSSIVDFPVREMNSPSGRLGILHEIGHALTTIPSWYSYYDRDLFRLIQLTTKFICESPQYQRLKTQKYRDALLVKEFYRQMQSSPVPKSEEEIEKCIKAFFRDERMAWAVGLKLYRRIKDERGIDLLGGMKREEAFNMVNHDLESYQNIYGKLLPENK